MGIGILDWFHEKANSNTQGQTDQSVTPNTDNDNNGNGNTKPKKPKNNNGNGGNGNHYGRENGNTNTGTTNNGNGVQSPRLTISPDYDGISMATNEIHNSYIINSLNQYAKITPPENGQANYRYDQNGNLIEDEKRIYHYDYQNRLIQADLKKNHLGNQDAYKLEYSYDPLGRRTRKKVTQGENESRLITYVYDGQDIAQENRTYENGSGNNFKKEYVYGEGVDDTLFHELIRNEQQKQFYYHKNHQGSVIALTDEKGKLVESYRYDNRGNVILGGFKHSTNSNATPR